MLHFCDHIGTHHDSELWCNSKIKRVKGIKGQRYYANTPMTPRSTARVHRHMSMISHRQCVDDVADWMQSSEWVSEQCFTSPPTQYRLYGRRFLQVKRPNQQYQSTEGESTKKNNTKKHKENRKYTHTQNSIQITVTQTNTASPLVYNNMGWLGDSSHRRQGR